MAPGRTSTARQSVTWSPERRSTSRGEPTAASSLPLLYECCPSTVGTHREPLRFGRRQRPIVRPIQEHGIMPLLLVHQCVGRDAKEPKQRNQLSRAPGSKPSADAGSGGDEMNPRRAVPRTPYRELARRGIAVVDSTGRVLNAPVYSSTATPKHVQTQITQPAAMQPTTPRRSHKLRDEMKSARSHSHSRLKPGIFGGPFCRNIR